MTDWGLVGNCINVLGAPIAFIIPAECLRWLMEGINDEIECKIEYRARMSRSVQRMIVRKEGDNGWFRKVGAGRWLNCFSSLFICYVKSWKSQRLTIITRVIENPNIESFKNTIATILSHRYVRNDEMPIVYTVLYYRFIIRL